jgi:hypothetical protein
MFIFTTNQIRNNFEFVPQKKRTLKNYLHITAIVISVFALNVKSFAQCSGGTSSGTITPTTTWSNAGTANVGAGNYYNFAATGGSMYYFSFCAADGSNSSSDTQISILDNSGNYAGGYNDDYCGAQSYLQWVCPSTGTYRVLVNLYFCQTTGNLGRLMYKYSPPLTCPSNMGGGVTNVSSLPYSSGAGTTCGAGNDMTSLNTIICGYSWYYDGEDRVWIFTPATSGTVSITLLSTGTYTGLMLYQGCPLIAQGGTCIANNQGYTGDKTLVVCLTAGLTYYLILDSYPFPACNPYSNLTISAPVPPGGCTTGTGTVNVSSLPYTSTNRTTCGKIDDVTATNSVTCGSSLYTSAEDEVFIFTPTATGTSTITVTSASSYVGITLFNGCPVTAGCTSSTGACVGYSQSYDGNQSMCVNLTSGITYYLVVDQFASPYCIPSYNITISAPSSAAPGTTCGNPLNISSLPFALTGESTTCMGNDYSNASTGSCASLYESGEDKVYRYIATAAECIGITLSSASTSSIGYQVYSGCPGTSGTTCIVNNGGATSGTLTGSATLPSAGTYYIIVDTWATPMSASYDISITSYGSGAPNDLPCNATQLSLGVYAQGNNNCSGGSGEPATPSCWYGGTLNTVWFKVTTTSTQLRIRTTPGSLTNSQIALFSGACGPGMTMLACNDDAPPCGSTYNYNSELTLTGLSNNTTYFICVDGYGNLTGSFGIIAIDPVSQVMPYSYGQECSVPNPVCNASISVGNPGWQAFGNYCDFPGGGGNCLFSGERGSSFYQINISANGTLTFDIVPNDWPGAPSTVSTDYDFALWRTTGAGAVNCASIAAGAVPLRCNYSYLGVTGIYSTVGISPPAYPGFGGAYDASLPVNAGDVLLLVVSNFSNSTSGFTVNFGASPINYAPTSSSVTWSGGVSSNWTQATNWGGCAIPSCTIDAVVAASSANQPVIAANQTVRNLIISPGASLTINAGVILTICGDYTNNGALIAAPSATIQFTNPTAVQNLNGSMTGINRFPNLVINKAGGSVSLNQDIDVGGSITTSNSTSVFNTNGHYIKLAGNFSNSNSNTTFTNVTGGTLEFNGTSSQTFTNTSGSLVLNNVVMNHTGTGVTISGANGNMNIGSAGILTLNTGKIITGSSNEVNVTNTSSGAVTPGSVSSYVEGRLRRSIAAAAVSYDFPVGNAAKGYERANITYTAAPTSTYNLLAFFSDWFSTPNGPVSNECPNVNYNSSPVLNHGYWTIDASIGSPSGTYTATFYNRSYTNNTGTQWSVMKRTPSATGAWGLNGACNMASSAASTIRTGMSGFSDFATVQFNSALPVELLFFTAERETQGVLITWSTAAEINSDYFVVEKSHDGNYFSDAGVVDGAGNSTEVLNYSLHDANPFNGMNYYRLRQVDFDESIRYSDIAAVDFSAAKNQLSVFPNPSFDLLQCEFYAGTDAEITLQVRDVTGKEMLSKKVPVTKGFNSIPLDINSLAFGVYHLQLLNPVDKNTPSLRSRFVKMMK